jgi:hypothetical protein
MAALLCVLVFKQYFKHLHALWQSIQEKEMKRLICFFIGHEWEIFHWITPYKKECKCCKKIMLYQGNQLWVDE